MKSATGLLLVLLFCSAVLQHSAEGKKKKPLLKGGLFKKFKFVPKKQFSDEFRGRFKHKKWDNYNKRWAGRQPGLFVKNNVKQFKGMLRLKGRWERNPRVFKDAPEGYGNYTTSFVQSKRRAKFGFFEVKIKPSNSRLSSSFWGSLDTPKRWTEIDVFEIGGGAKFEGVDYRQRINMNVHVFRDKKKNITLDVNDIHKPTFYTHHVPLRKRFHVYSVDWAPGKITWMFNGRAIRREHNKYWKQAFPLKFDVETMPYWFGLPSRRTLPAWYRIKYIRAWSRRRKKNKKKKNNKQRNVVADDATATARQFGGGLLSPGTGGVQTQLPGFGSLGLGNAASPGAAPAPAQAPEPAPAPATPPAAPPAPAPAPGVGLGGINFPSFSFGGGLQISLGGDATSGAADEPDDRDDEDTEVDDDDGDDDNDDDDDDDDGEVDGVDNGDDEDEDEEDGDEDEDGDGEAESQALAANGGESEVPLGGLQRGATNKNEHVYKPVLAPGGMDWSATIDRINQFAEDIADTLGS